MEISGKTKIMFILADPVAHIRGSIVLTRELRTLGHAITVMMGPDGGTGYAEGARAANPNINVIHTINEPAARAERTTLIMKYLLMLCTGSDHNVVSDPAFQKRIASFHDFGSDVLCHLAKAASASLSS